MWDITTLAHATYLMKSDRAMLAIDTRNGVTSMVIHLASNVTNSWIKFETNGGGRTLTYGSSIYDSSLHAAYLYLVVMNYFFE